jgi:perosamine synthetase
MIATANAVRYTGAAPVLVDAEPHTLNINPHLVEAAITERTKAIIVVHTYGHPADLYRLTDIAERRGLHLIEDAAEAHGAEIAGRRVGSFGLAGTFSFYANKIITTGEGGMVVTTNPTFAERLRSYRNLCFRPERRFLHTELGHNYRMTNLQAAVGLSQIERIEDHIARKRRMAAWYRERLAGFPLIALPVERAWAKNVYWMHCIVLDELLPFDAAELAVRLRQRGVDTRPLFIGMHEQPVLRERGLFAGEAYPVTDRLARRGLYLPSGLTLTEAQVDQVTEALCDAAPELRS